MRLKKLSALFLLASACADSEAPKTTVIDQGSVGDNGVSLNGVSLNGVSLNGVSLQGVSLQGVSLQGVSLNGVSLQGVSLNGTSPQGVSLQGVSLNGVSLNGVSLNGTEFVGASFHAILSNSSTMPMRIDDMGVLAAPNDDVYTYDISVKTDGGWQAICGYEADGVTAISAIAVPGVWNTTTGAWSDDGSQITLACRGASIAKCVELGYKTWDGFADHHHACVRMLRADYCGDGTTYTTNGTAINLYDNAGVQVDTESWLIDAEWTANGALCFNNYRGGTLPSCSSKHTTSCGSFANGALLINERQ